MKIIHMCMLDNIGFNRILLISFIICKFTWIFTVWILSYKNVSWIGFAKFCWFLRLIANNISKWSNLRYYVYLFHINFHLHVRVQTKLYVVTIELLLLLLLFLLIDHCHCQLLYIYIYTHTQFTFAHFLGLS